MSDIKKLEKIIKISFDDQQLITTALTHRSHLNENREVQEHNERLEFLGDACLELVTTEFLFHTFPDKAEGELTALRAALVRKENLSKSARSLDLGSYLLMSKGEDQGGGRDNDYILANTVEALIGAIYLDQGYETAKEFVSEYILTYLPQIMQHRLDRDAKSYLQELAQERDKVTPTYSVVEERGPDHEKEFDAVAYIADQKVGTGTGNSKQAAELKAAQDALERLGWE